MFLRNSTISLWNCCRYGTAPFAFATYWVPSEHSHHFLICPVCLADPQLGWCSHGDREQILSPCQSCNDTSAVALATPCHLLCLCWLTHEKMALLEKVGGTALLLTPWNTDRISGALLLGHVMVKTNSGYLYFLVLSWCISDVETEAGIMHLLGEKSTWHQSNIRISAFALPSSHYSRPLFPSTIRT